jgi:hypothetical protein
MNDTHWTPAEIDTVIANFQKKHGNVPFHDGNSISLSHKNTDTKQIVTFENVSFEFILSRAGINLGSNCYVHVKIDIIANGETLEMSREEEQSLRSIISEFIGFTRSLHLKFMGDQNQRKDFVSRI